MTSFLESPEVPLNIRRLEVAWDGLRPYGKEVCLHIYTNRAADDELAKLLADDRILPAVIEGNTQKQRRARLKAVAEIAREDEFKQFLCALRFDLRQHSLDQLREHIQQYWIQHRLGLDPKEAYQRLMFNVEKWGLESQSRPIQRQEVLQAYTAPH